MLVLGIETSCDETAASVVHAERGILSNLVLSQIEEHRVFGGVVPEIAARAHLDHLDALVAGAMQEAGIDFPDLSGVAATCGPGLIGGVMVGMMSGKAIAAVHDLPFIAVNHLEAHALTPRLTDSLEFPYLLLLISGGHTQLLAVEDVGHYKLLGTTLDDALGEAFDKSAKLMGLPYPGGPNLEKAARRCKNPQAALQRFPLPRPLSGRKDSSFSFSGLKTAVRTHVQSFAGSNMTEDDKADLAFSFQIAVSETLEDRCGRAISGFLETYGPGHALVASGGVAANLQIRTTLEGLAARAGMSFLAPPLNLCSDNAAMVAWTGIERLRRGLTDSLSVPARPRWPLQDGLARTSGVSE